MRKLLFILVFIPFICKAQSNYYVATNGSNGNPGTLAQPWRTWDYAFAQLDAGDTLDIRGGIYYSKAPASIDPVAWPTPIGETGTAEAKITIRGYAPDVTNYSDTTWTIVNGDTTGYKLGNIPVLDCRYHKDSIPDPGYNIYNSGISLNRVEHIVFKDFDVRNVWQIDSVVSGAFACIGVANITYENIEVYNIGQRGFYQTSGAWTYADSAFASYLAGGAPTTSAFFDGPDTSIWINVDVHDVCDTFAYTPGNAGDCWKTIAYDNNSYYYWEQCRAWDYTDDGWDPSSGTRVFVDCWAMSGSKYVAIGPEWDTENNGFKLNGHGGALELGYYTEADSLQIVNDSLYIVKRCIALFNSGTGFICNITSNSGNGRLYNNTAYLNGINWFIAGESDTVKEQFINCIAFAATTTNAIGKPYNIASASREYFAQTCSWIANGYANSDNPAFDNDSTQYVTTDSTTLERWFKKPRNADRTLNMDSIPMMLTSGSSFIDGGTDVGLAYTGSTPDVGYYEYNTGTGYANFICDSATLCIEQFNDFTDASTNSPSAWEWTFEGGTPGTSSDQNPRIQYNTSGSYDVQLIAIGTPNDTLLVENYITVRDSIVADFSASSTSVQTGANITFTDLTSGGDPTSRSWTFAGGIPSTSTAQNPVIQYNTAGTYTVTLVSTNVCNEDTEQKVGYITVTNPYVPPAPSNYKLIINFK